MNKLTGLEILRLPMKENDAHADTIGEFLITLLQTLWDEGESFSGKRPFGNSGWECIIYEALVLNGAIKGKISTYDGEVEVEDYDEKKARKAIDLVFESLYDYVKSK